MEQKIRTKNKSKSEEIIIKRKTKHKSEEKF